MKISASSMMTFFFTKAITYLTCQTLDRNLLLTHELYLKKKNNNNKNKNTTKQTPTHLLSTPVYSALSLCGNTGINKRFYCTSMKLFM